MDLNQAVLSSNKLPLLGSRYTVLVCVTLLRHVSAVREP